MNAPATIAALRHAPVKTAEILKQAATRKKAILDDDAALKGLTDSRRKGLSGK